MLIELKYAFTSCYLLKKVFLHQLFVKAKKCIFKYFQICTTTMAIGELRALPVGRGQIGKVKYIPVGSQVRGSRGIPASVIKTGVKLPQVENGNQEENVRNY